MCHHSLSLTQEFGRLPDSHQSDMLAVLAAVPSVTRRRSPSNGVTSVPRKIDWTDSASASAVAFSALPPRTTGNWGRRPSLSSRGRKRDYRTKVSKRIQSVQLILEQLLRRWFVVDDTTSPPPWVGGSDQIGCWDGFWVDKTVF